ncbi:MAG: GAF domain-containing protein [Anaerolineaceae bacterium]|nr:GAF domain-containing protein [Anaerolineaceae bacterium]
MKRSLFNALIIWLMGLVTLVTLVINLPDQAAITEYGLYALIYGGVTAFMLYYGVLLAEGELSAAHVAGIIAFLSLPPASRSIMTWAIFLGGLIGGFLLVIREDTTLLRRRITSRTAQSVVVISARVTLSFLVAGQLYIWMGGITPLTSPLRDSLPALFVFSLAYIVIYLAIFLLESYSDGRSVAAILGRNSALIFVILVLPIPFSILGALLTSLAPTTIVFDSFGAALLSRVIYGASRVQYRQYKQVEEQRVLSAVSHALQSNLNLNAILNTIYDQVARLLRVEHFLVALYAADQKHLTYPIYIKAGKSAQRTNTNSGKTLLDYLLETHRPLLISRDIQAEAERLGVYPPDEVIYSWLGVPLQAGGRQLGAIVVTSGDPQQHFGPDDLRLLNVVAATASVAIDNAQLYERQTARANQLSTLNRVISLLTGTLSPDEVLDTIVSSASVISDATAIAVYLYWDDKRSSMALVRSVGLSDRFTADTPGPLLRSPLQRLVIINDMARDERATPYRDLMTREGKAAWIELPLPSGDSSAGTLLFYFDEPQTFTEEGIEILRTFASQSAQAIMNAQLYSTTDKALEKRAEQMYSLAALGRQLTASMNVNMICNLVLARAIERTRSVMGFIAIRDDDTEELLVAAQSGYPPNLWITSSRIEQTITGEVFLTGEPVLYTNLPLQNATPTLLSSVHSHLSVPILRNRQVVGAITLESELLGDFTQDDTTFVAQLASQTMIAVDNARLFERVREARDRMQVILNAMKEAIILLGKSGQIVLANPRVEMLGLNAKQIANKQVESLLDHPELALVARMGFESANQVRELIRELQVPGKRIGGEPMPYALENEFGTIYIERQIIPVDSEDGEALGALLVFYDETRDRELARMREDFSRMVVHDLRSPLTAVTTGLKMLRDVVPDDNQFKPLVLSTADTSQRAIRKLLSRVDALLDISKMESGQLTLEIEPMELATLVDSVSAELSPLARELEVTVTSDVPDSLPLLGIDSDKVERVLQNLVDNALKFTPADGVVTIKASPTRVQDESGEFIRVAVTDTGPGIPDGQKSRIFDRYVQIEGRRGARRGTGLGLTFCRMVIEAHGGHIWVEDNPEGGSVFAFTLPVSTARRLDETGEWPSIRHE